MIVLLPWNTTCRNVLIWAAYRLQKAFRAAFWEVMVWMNSILPILWQGWPCNCQQAKQRSEAMMWELALGLQLMAMGLVMLVLETMDTSLFTSERDHLILYKKASKIIFTSLKNKVLIAFYTFIQSLVYVYIHAHTHIYDIKIKQASCPH